MTAYEKTASLGALLLSLIPIALWISGCQSIERNGTDPRPQVYFGILEQTVVKGQEVKIPVVMQQAPSGDLSLGYTVETKLESTEYDIRPEKLSFSPKQLSDTIYITSKSDRKESENLTLRLSAAPEGYRLGAVNFIDVAFASPLLISFKSLEYTLHKEGLLSVNLKNTSGRTQKALQDMSIEINIDRQNSSAKEGEHFDFPDGKILTIKKGQREGTIRIRQLKQEVGHTVLRLSLSKAPNTVFGQNPTTGVTFEPPYDFTGHWLYSGSVIADNFSFMESGKYPPIDGKEGDQISISGDTDKLDFTFDLGSSLSAYFPKSTKGTFNREFINYNFDAKEWTAYKIDGINILISPNATKIRPAEVAFNIDGNELTVYVYDMEPIEYFLDTYNYMNDGSFIPPMIGYPAVYYFKKAE